MRRKATAAPALCAVLAIALVVPGRAETPVHVASLRASQVPGFKVSSCSYQLVDSKAGNKNYYLLVNVKYVVSQPVAAVRFAFDIDNVMQYTIGQNLRLGSGSQQFKLISPRSVVTNVTCSAAMPLP
jgi:hypothetical protein